MSFADIFDEQEGLTAVQNELADFMATDTTIPSEHTPKLHALESLLSHTRITFSSGEEQIPHRELFDVKHELMQRDELSQTEEILLGLTNEDIKINTYEGGLKVWECSYDMIQVLQNEKEGFKRCLELGCGAALPSAYILQQCIKNNVRDVTLVLADFNASVLQLVTAPNMLLAWKSAADGEFDGEIEVTPELVRSFSNDLQQRGIQLQFISGAWSSQFVKTLDQKCDLVLASETIYSPETLPVFTDTLLHCLEGRALVAAKKIYFGVGGGIPDFVVELERRNAKFEMVLNKTDGIGRGVLLVRK